MAPAGENNVPSNRLPYNTRQRQPSTDSETSSISDIQQMDGPGANEYKFVEHTHPNQVLLGLNELRKAGQFCDVTLSVDGTKFPAHRNVLSSFSPYFRAMFLSKLAESKQSVVALRGIEADMLGLLLDYAYTSCIVITRTNVQSLLSAANLLQILPVKDAACDFLERHMDASNCLGIHCFAEQHACTELQNTAKNYALMNFWEVFHQEEFLGLTANKLIELTTSDELEVDKEEAVFQAVARWYNHNPETRKIDFHKVLETVRLPLLSPYFLHDCVESLHVIRQSSECSRLVEEAKLYHLLPDRRSELTSCRTKQRNSADTVEVIVAVGGEDDKVVLRSVECYCTKTRVWKTLNCLPFAVSKHGLVVSGKNTLYLAGGEFPDGSASRSVWRYDPVLDFWLEVASMLVPRSELGLAMLDGFVYAVGGWEGSYRLDSVERYDPSTNSWSLIEPMKLAVTSPAVIAHDGMLYVTGRYSYPQIHIGGAILEDGDGIELVQRYDPRNDMWTELAPMLIPRSGAAICVLDSCIYVIGGWHASTENTNRVERYSVLSNTWEFKASMLERRYRPGIAVMDGLIYVLGGEEGWDRYHDSIECYNPVTDSWCLVGEMPTSRSWLSCAPLQLKEKDRINKTRKSKPSQSKSRFQLQNKIVRCTDFEFEFEFEF